MKSSLNALMLSMSAMVSLFCGVSDDFCQAFIDNYQRFDAIESHTKTDVHYLRIGSHLWPVYIKNSSQDISSFTATLEKIPIYTSVIHIYVIFGHDLDFIYESNPIAGRLIGVIYSRPDNYTKYLFLYLNNKVIRYCFTKYSGSKLDKVIIIAITW